jgi:RNA polymerase sigma-70 factor (ECF subfamily)
MNLSTQSDTELFRALQSGNHKALGVLYDRYGTVVYRLALRILRNESEAEDLTQDIFVSFWRKNTYDPDRGSVSVFLMTLTRSRAIDRIRKAKTQQKFLQKIGRSDSMFSPGNLMEKVSLAEISKLVRSALQQLPENQRQVLEMAYYDGMSQSEINRTLNIPLGTVKTRARQGLIKLRHILKDLVE